MLPLGLLHQRALLLIAIVKTFLQAHLHHVALGPRMNIAHHLATRCVVEGTRHVDGRGEGQGKEKGGRMDGGERSAHNDTPVLIERTGASSAQTRSSGARREAGIGTEPNGTRMSLVCFSSPSPPPSQGPVPDPDWTAARHTRRGAKKTSPSCRNGTDGGEEACLWAVLGECGG